MSSIVLSDDLFKVYFGFMRDGKVSDNGSGYQIQKVSRLLISIREFYTNQEQLNRCGITDEMIMATEASIPLLTLDKSTTVLKDLVLRSKLKLLLVDKAFSDDDIISYNILKANQKCGFHYSMTFKSGEGKLFAKRHIIKLLVNAPKIEIVDPYFDNNQFNVNLSLLNELVTNQENRLDIVCKPSNDSCSLKSRLEDAGYTNVKCPPIGENIHDRYIKTNDIKIHLSSGFHALTQQNKELTYMVELLG